MQQKRTQLRHEEDVLLREVQALDAAEDRQCGGARRGDEWPAELAFRGDRDTPAGGPPNKAQRNFTDPESRFMPNAGGKDIGLAYNCLAFVDSAQQVIVADRAAAQSGDKQQALPKIRETTQMCPGRSPRMRAATTPRCRRPTCLFPRERMRWKLRTR